MRLLLVSDLHYALRQFDWLLSAAPDFDLVVLAGDQLDISSSVEVDAQIVVVLKYLELLAARTSLVVSSGNHDLTGLDTHGEQAALWLDEARRFGVHTDGDSLTIDDTLITICPWWDGPIGRETVSGQLALDAARRPEQWVWVYHWPPVDSPTSWTGHRYYGDSDLAGWIREFQPDVVLTGHVHQPPFRPDGSWADRIDRTWVFNPGRQTGPVPSRVEIDLTEQHVAWVSMLGFEEVALGAECAPARTVV